MENLLLFIGGIGVFEIILILIFGLLPIILWIYAIVDLIKRDFTDSTNKLIWALVIIFMPVLGAILYLLLGRK